MLSDLPVLSATLAAGTVWALSRHIQERQKRRQLPPGPPGLPFIGSVLSFPKEQKWLTFTKWARKYGTFELHFIPPRVQASSVTLAYPIGLSIRVF
jgi:hypothetical protein